MPAITLAFAVLLVLLGIAGFVGTGSAHYTALIPVGFGILLAILAAVARKPAARMHAMHAAVLIGLVALIVPAWRVVAGLRAGKEWGVAATCNALMAALSLIYVLLCVRSFITARRQREQRDASAPFQTPPAS